jgi:signal transduction histidine kinase
MGGILVVFAAAIYTLGARDRLLTFDAELETKARVMAAGIRYGLHRGEWRIKLDDVPVLGSNTLPFDHNLAYARWYDAQGDLVRFVRQAPLNRRVEGLGFTTLPAGSIKETSLRQITLPVYQNDKVIGYLEVAAPLTPVQQQLQRQLVWFSLGVPLALVTICFTGWWLGGLAMAPLRHSHQRLQQFTSQASHELRTPLAQVLSHVQLVLQAETIPAERWRLERIAAITKTMSQMVGDLLFLARHSGQLDPDQLQLLDLRDLVQELAWDYSAIATRQQIDLTCDLPSQPVWVIGNIDLLHQALVNLADNALKYTPGGNSIRLIVAAQLGWATVQVLNTGVSIAPQSLPQLFEQFYRSPGNEDIQGFGLGLAIARQIVQAHGGDIVATSADIHSKNGSHPQLVPDVPPSPYTCFTLRLPLGLPR